MNIDDNDNGQSTTNQNFPFSSTYSPDDVFGLSDVTYGWPQNNLAHNRRTFTTSSPLSVGFFPTDTLLNVQLR